MGLNLYNFFFLKKHNVKNTLALPTYKLASKLLFLLTTETKTLHTVIKGKFILVKKREFVSKRIPLQPRQQRCWAPEVSLTMWSPHQVEDQREHPQTLFLRPSFLSVDPPPGPLYTQFQRVHALRVWIWAQAEPWGELHLPQCTVAKHRGQSRSFSCCNTTEGEKKTLLE